MGWRDDLDLESTFRSERRAIQNASAFASPEIAQRLAYEYQRNGYLNPEITASIVLGGGDSDLLSAAEKAAVEQMLRDGVGRDADARKNAPEVDGDSSWFEDLSGGLFSGLKAVSRGAFTAFDSITETAVGVLGTPFSPGARKRMEEQGFLNGLADYLSDIPQSTSLWEVGSQFAKTGRVDIGSGYFVGGEVEAGQTQRQRDLVGTIERNGQVYAWTPGRGLADFTADIGLISENDWAWNVISGALDATVAIVTDPTNYIPGVGWGDDVIKGVRATQGRRAIKYTRLIEQADRYQAAGDLAQATHLRKRAMGTIGAKWNGFDLADPTEVALRSQLMDEVGRGADSIRSVDVASFMAHLSRGSGKRLVKRMIETDNEYEIFRLHRGNIGPSLINDLAAATTPDEVVGAYTRALLNPAKDLSNQLAAVPSLGLFRMTDKGMWVRRTFNGATRLGRYIPEDALLLQSKPTQYLKKLEMLFDVFPTGVVDTGVKTSRYNPQLKADFMNEAIRVLASGDQAALFSLNQRLASTFSEMFKNLGYTPDSVKTLVKWSDESNRYMAFEMNRIAAGEPPDRLPLLVTQLLSSGAMLINTEQFTKVVRDAGRFKQVLRTKSKTAKRYFAQVDEVDSLKTQLDELRAANPNDLVGERALVRQLEEADKKLNSMRTSENQLGLMALRGLGNAGDAAISKMWKPFQLMRGAFIARVVGEETIRVTNSGTFGGRDRLVDYVLASFGGHYKMDAVGRSFQQSAREFDEIDNLVKDLLDDLASARQSGNQLEIARVNNELDAARAQLDELIETAHNNQQFYHQALLNANPGAAYATATRNPKKVMYQSGQAKNVRKSDPGQLDEWVEAMADRLLKFHFDVPMRQYARGGPGPEAEFVVNGVLGTAPQHFAAGRIGTVDEAMAYWHMTGGGREYLDKVAAAYRAASPEALAGRTLDPDNFDDVVAWIGRMKEEYRYIIGGQIDPVTGNVIGGNDVLREVIGTGRIGGRQVERVVKNNRNTQIDETLLRELRDFATLPNSPEWIEHLGRNFYGEDKVNVMERVTEFFFKGMYGTSSDKLARSPSFRRIYWKQVAQFVDRLSADDAARMLANAREAKISKTTLAQIEARARNARGVATLEDVDEVAKAAALTHVSDLLFDASKRGATMDSLRLIIPFGDAYSEVMKTWSRLFVQQRGKPLYRGLRAGEAAMGADVGPFGPGDLFGMDENGEVTPTLDGRNESFVYRDPTAEDLRVMIPGSRQLSKLLLGGDMPGVGLPMPVRSFSLVGGLLPGIGPVADQVVSQAIPDEYEFDWVRQLLFPYGAPEEVGRPETRQGVEDYVVPAWAQKFAALPIFKDIPIVNVLADLANDKFDDPGWQTTRSQLLAQAYSTGAFPQGFEGKLAAEQFAEKAADKIYAMRGFMQFFSPGSPLSMYMAETEEGDLIGSLLVEQLKDLENQLVERGQPTELGLAYMLDTYGPDIWMYGAPVSKAAEVKGVEATDAWYEWYRQNEAVVEGFPLIGGFFGPVGGEFSINAYGNLRREGVYQVGTPQERYETAARRLAFLAYNRLRDSMGPEELRSDADKALLAMTRNNIEQYFNVDMENSERRSERELQIRQAYSLLESVSPEAQTLMDTATGQSLRDYLEARQRVVELASAYGITNWQQAKRAVGFRMVLRNLAAELSAADANFARMYEYVFEREMLDDLEVAR